MARSLWPEPSLPSFCSWLVKSSLGYRPPALSHSLLPNLAKHLPAQAFFACLAAGHHALRGGENVDTESTQNARDLGAPHVHAAAGPRDTLHVRDGGFVVRAVLEVHTNDLVSL